MHREAPQSIIFFPNGLTAVCDSAGQQMPRYQRSHQRSIQLLARDGFDWKRIPIIDGEPKGGSPESIPFEVAKRIATDHELRQVILVCWDGVRTHVVTYGVDLVESAQAGQGGNVVKRALGWPESLCDAWPARIEALHTEIGELKAKLAAVKEGHREAQ